jgi:hypothetical protein
MLRPRDSFIFKTAFVAFLAAGASGMARAQAPANPGADPGTQGYAAFASTLTSMTTASSVLVQSPDERSVGRLLFLRKTLATKLIAAISSASASGKDVTITFGDLDARALLCDFRSRAYAVVSKGELSSRDSSASVTVDYLGAKADVKYLTAVAGKINAAAPAKPTDLISALQLLFTNYNFQVAPVTVTTGNRDAVAYSCNKDMSEFASAYYGTKIEAGATIASAIAGAAPAAGGTLPDLSIFGPIGVFIQTALGIVTPVVEDIATFESAQARQQAIIKFLSDPKNEAAMRAAGTNLAQAISDYTFAKRMSLAGTFAEQVAVIKAAAPIDVTKVAACTLKPDPSAPPGSPAPKLADVMLPAAMSTAPSNQFMICYRAVWALAQDGISSVLTAAANYDALADPGDTATLLTEFNKQAANDFAQVKKPPPDQSSLAYVLAVVSFASDVATAISPANRTKLEQSITAMVKAY